MKTSDWLLIIMISVVCASSVQGQFNVGADVLGELISFPLTKNPFFAKVAGMAGKMDTDGILLNDTDMSGNNCHVLGNLKCEGGETPHCSGMGIIDCTDECPGTEEEFKHFREVMEDPELETKFPNLGAMIKNKDKKEDMSNDMKDDDSEKMEKTEDMGDEDEAKKKFMESLTKCTSWSAETLALLNLVKGDGLKFGAVSTDPNDLTYVAPGAISNISQIEYDYSDYYDDLEEDSDKTKREAEVEVQIVDVKRHNDIEVKIEKNPDSVKMKQDYLNKLNGIDDFKDMSEDEKINMNMIRSVDESQETDEAANNTTMIDYADDGNSTATENDTISDVVKREVEELRSLFHSAVKQVRKGEVMKGTDMVAHIARKMLRKKRELEPEMKSSMSQTCVVKNMSCSTFPLKSKCKGIGVGRCGSNADLLKQFFTPHVVMVSSVSVIVIVMVTVGLTYYCYKMKTENRIEPSEEEEQERHNGAVKNHSGTQTPDIQAPA